MPVESDSCVIVDVREVFFTAKRGLSHAGGERASCPHFFLSPCSLPSLYAHRPVQALTSCAVPPWGRDATCVGNNMRKDTVRCGCLYRVSRVIQGTTSELLPCTLFRSETHFQRARAPYGAWAGARGRPITPSVERVPKTRCGDRSTDVHYGVQLIDPECGDQARDCPTYASAVNRI